MTAYLSDTSPGQTLWAIMRDLTDPATGHEASGRLKDFLSTHPQARQQLLPLLQDWHITRHGSAADHSSTTPVWIRSGTKYHKGIGLTWQDVIPAPSPEQNALQLFSIMRGFTAAATSKQAGRELRTILERRDDLAVKTIGVLEAWHKDRQGKRPSARSLTPVWIRSGREFHATQSLSWAEIFALKSQAASMAKPRAEDLPPELTSLLSRLALTT